MVLVLAEQQNGKFKNATLTAVTAGAQIAKDLGVKCTVLALGQADDPASLGDYGASEVYTMDSSSLATIDSKVYTSLISELATREKVQLVIVSHTSTGKQLLGRLAIRLRGGYAAGVSKLQVENGNIRVTRSAFSGKAIETYLLSGPCNVISLLPNASPIVKNGSPCNVQRFDVPIPAPSVVVREVRRTEGRIPLPEADIVVSAGRGMKDPSNWGIIEELAGVLGATTACSRPVADSGWRPHHEHVGQTGLAIRPNLYIAIGISGAIQHLAGVNNSKVIVVINKDPEAPFFKAADYGVCADLFEVVPKLTEALRKARA